MATANNTDNVSYGKGVTGGYFFLAPLGTALPTDNTTDLDEAFVNMGYLGDDGITFSDSSDTETGCDLNGDAIATSQGSIEKTFTVVFREIKADTLKVMMGDSNVTDADGVIEAHDKGPNDTTYVAVFELLLKDDRKWRRIVPQCKPGELGDMQFTYSELVGREITMAALKDGTTGDYYIDYIDSTETAGAVGTAAVGTAVVGESKVG